MKTLGATDIRTSWARLRIYTQYPLFPRSASKKSS
jgi:hypothetical protein